MYPNPAQYQQPYGSVYQPQPHAVQQFPAQTYGTPQPGPHHGHHHTASLQYGQAQHVPLNNHHHSASQSYGQIQHALPNGHHHTPSQSYGQQPPAKRQKGTAVVTRYAPPPGYVPPPNAHVPPYVQPPAVNQYQNYTGQPGYAGYGAQGHQQHQQNYQIPGYPQPTGWQQPHAYSQGQAYPQLPYQHPAASEPQPYPMYPPHSRAMSVAASQPTYPLPTPTLPQKRSFSVSDAKVTPPRSDAGTDEIGFDYGFDIDLDENGDAADQQSEDVNHELSLGVIMWYPANLVKTALPATFKEAELEDIAPSKPREAESDSISQYFIPRLLYQIELSVRQTEEWEKLKHDSIFTEFSASPEFVSISLLKQHRDRPDPAIKIESGIDAAKDARATVVEPARVKSDPPPEPQIKAEETGNDHMDDDQAMDTESDDEEQSQAGEPTPKAVPAANLLDNFEQALDTSNSSRFHGNSYHSARASSPEKSGMRTSHARPDSASRQNSQPPVPAAPRNEQQESLLAALGVEGSPKRVFPTPGPALGPLPPDRRESMQSNPSRSGSLGAPTVAAFNPRLPFGPNNFPPPPPPKSPEYDPWRAHDTNGRGGDSPKSNASQHTAVGSDFNPEDTDMDATPKPAKPTIERTASVRKRPFDDYARPDSDGRRRQAADAPRKRRPPPKVSEAYSRRW